METDLLYILIIYSSQGNRTIESSKKSEKIFHWKHIKNMTLLRIPFAVNE